MKNFCQGSFSTFSTPHSVLLFSPQLLQLLHTLHVLTPVSSAKFQFVHLLFIVLNLIFVFILVLPQEIFGYRTQSCRKTLCLAGSIFSFGILPLVFYWKPAWHVWANCIPCSLQEADVVLLRTTVSVSLVLCLAALSPEHLDMGWLWGGEHKAVSG